MVSQVAILHTNEAHTSSPGKEPIEAEELAFIRQMGQLSNVVPIIARADEFYPKDLISARARLLEQLQGAEVNICDLLHLFADWHERELGQKLLAVSSALARDNEIIDASVLMSSGYVQPLELSDLHSLTEGLFDGDTAAYLRHHSLRKFVLWRRTQSLNTPSASLGSLRNARRTGSLPTVVAPIYHESAASSISAKSVAGDSTTPSAVLVDRRKSQPDAYAMDSFSEELSRPFSSKQHFSADAYTAARLLDHTQREERLAQVRLARWAADLQRAIRNERARFTALKQIERTAWLEERLEECVNLDGEQKEHEVLIRKSSHATEQLQRIRTRSPGDPLGLLEWHARLSQRGVLVAKLVGGAGVVGAVILFVARTWGWKLELIPETYALRNRGGLSDWWWARDW